MERRFRAERRSSFFLNVVAIFSALVSRDASVKVSPVKSKWSSWLPWLPVGMMVAFAITCWPSFLPESLKNFSASYAIAFCAGVYFPSRLKWILPLATLLVMDFILNIFYYEVQPISAYTVSRSLPMPGLSGWEHG